MLWIWSTILFLSSSSHNSSSVCSSLVFLPFSCLFLSSLCAAAGYGDSVYRVCGYMCLDSSSQSQADTFKLVFDEQPNSRVSYLIWCHVHTCLLIVLTRRPPCSQVSSVTETLIFWKFKLAFVPAKLSSINHWQPEERELTVFKSVQPLNEKWNEDQWRNILQIMNIISSTR